MRTRIDTIIEKINTRGLSMLAALIMIAGGIYMCIKEITTTGKIDLKTAFLEGQIETGSLGLMSMFLGVVVILALNYRSQPYKGQEVELVLDGTEVKAKGLSYRKLQEIVSAVNNGSSQVQSHDKQSHSDP